MPAENNDSISVAESNEILAEKAIREGFLYHGSPNRYAVLKPQTQEDVNGKKVLSFSPFKSIASMFVIPVDRLIRGYHRCRLRYDEWFNMSKDKYQPLTTVHVYHNIKQLGDFEKVFSGYLYTVKAEDVLQNATDNPKWRGEKEVLAYASEIHPVKTEQISVKVVFKYDLKRCGTDHDAVPSGTSEETLMVHKWSMDEIFIHKASDITDEQWKLITESVNLAAKASGDEAWTEAEVKNKILKNKLEVYFFLQHKYEASKTDRSFTETYHPLGAIQFNPKTMFITNFAIFKKAQGQGVGFLALKKFMMYIKSRYPNKDIYINVASSNKAAKAVYKKVGFTELSEENGACKMVYKLGHEGTSTEALRSTWTIDDIKSIDDLKQFYKTCRYSLVDWKADKCWKETHKNTELEDWERGWKLLTPEQVVKYRCGVCWDTAMMSHYFLSKWNVEHQFLFSDTKRAVQTPHSDKYNDDPTHTFVIYKDQGKWRWLEGSWGPFKSNNWIENNPDTLIKNVTKALANNLGVTYLTTRVTTFPKYGITMKEFYTFMEKFINHPQFEVQPDIKYSKENYYYGMNEEDFIPDSAELSMEMMTIQNVSMEENVVQEQGTYVLIRGFPVAAFFKQLSKHYQTHKLENLIHVVHSIGIAQWTVNTRTVKIHRFFLPEIVYLLTKFNMSQTLIGDIQRGSWMGAPITNKTDCKVERISANMNCTLMPHQQTFVENYADLKDSHRLRGYLLSFGQGLGKTITAIALMEALGKERVVVICPKNTMVETWKSHFQRFYKKEQSIYVAGFDKKFNGERFCIFNYDAIDKLNALDGVKTSKMGIIVDESHNFLRIEAARTRKLISLAKGSDDADVLLISGTPIKSNGKELIPLISMLDPLFDDEAATIFKDSFGVNTKIATEVLHARLKRMMERVTKDALNLPPKRRSVIKVKLPDGRKYTIKEVKKGMKVYINERLKFHRDHMVEYRQEFDECMRYLQTRPIAKTPEFQKYRAVIERLMKHGGRFDQGDEEVAWANAYEKSVVEREFPSELLQKFRHCKAAIKYLHLKVRGEVLGQYLAKLRIEMTTALLKAVNIKQLIDEAEKKTIIFSSFIDTIETCEQHVRALGYKPIIIYGKNSSEIAPLAAKFQKDQSYNPLIASLQTLSTGATLTAANRVIFLNKPWRSIDYEQASDRVHRIGQDTAVDIISLVLDTGEEGNLSTRMEDIMDASARAFDAIVEEKKKIEDRNDRMSKEDYVFDLLDLPDDVLDEENISLEGMTLLNDTKEQRTLNRMAKPHYRPRGANSWEHVQQDLANGILLTHAIKHRDLTLQEYATILYHDCGCRSIYPNKDGHGLKGVGIAKPDLKKCGFFSDKEIEEICVAILEHDETTNPKNHHSSELSDLLASADTNPPDLPWILNKSYVWGLRHGETNHKKNIANVVKFMTKIYGSDGEMIYPKLYKEYYKDEIKQMQKFFDQLTEEQCEKIVTEYREKHDLTANELTLPEPNTEQKITTSVEMLLRDTSEQIKLNKIAKLFYKPTGSNSWQHVQQDVTNGVRMVKKVENRDLTLQEYATILFHDSACKSMTERKGHGVKSAEIAKMELSKLGFFSAQQIEEICVAIREHDSSFNKDKKYSSKLSDFLISADSDPIDIPWIMNKYYVAARGHGLEHEECIQYLSKSLPAYYGTNGKLVYPKLYRAYYADKIKEMNKFFDHVTPEQIEQTITKYRKAHKLGENDRRLPDPSFESLDVSEEGMMLLRDTNEQRALNRLAKPFYKDKGANSWEHIQQDMYHGIIMLHEVKHRKINLQEYATILFHDCAYKTHPDGEKHGVYGAEIARPILEQTGFFTDKEVDEICQAIVEHDFSSNKTQKFSSELSDFLISADSNPINMPWIMNKCYAWAIKHGKTHEEAVQHVVDFEPSIYGSKGKFVYPKLYKAFYGDAIKAMQNFFDNITYEEADKIITAYRKRHRLSAKDLRLPDPSLESLEISNEGMPARYAKMQFANNQNKKRIWDACKKYYSPSGSHGVNHIQEVMATAYFMKGKKDLTDAEYAAIAFHDVGRPQETDKNHHNVISVKIAKEILPKMDIFSNEELEAIYRAILNHSHSWRKEQNIKLDQLDEFSALVAYADRGFPQTSYYEICLRPTLWILEGNDRDDNPVKMKRLNNYRTVDDIAQGVYETLEDIKDKRHSANENSIYTRAFAREIAKQNDLREKISVNIIKPVVVKIMKDYGYTTVVGVEGFSTESLEPSMEAVKNIKEKRKKIEDYILKSMKLLDPHTDTNYKYWKNKFDSMSDKDFDNFMHYLREGKTNIHMFVPPFKVTLQTKEMLDAAHKLGVKIMHRIWMTDPHTGIRYLTPEEYMVLQLPVRRQQQFLDEKLSVPDNDKTIDGLTGQVTGDSKSCSITNPEIQILHARNLDATLYEFSNVRGGNIRNYAEFKRSLEETGSVKLEQLDPTNRTRVAVMGQVLLTAMHLDVNLVDI